MVTLPQCRRGIPEPLFLSAFGIRSFSLERLFSTTPTMCSKVSLFTRPRTAPTMALLRLRSMKFAGLPALRFRYQLTNGILLRRFQRRTVSSALMFSRRRRNTVAAKTSLEIPAKKNMNSSMTSEYLLNRTDRPSRRPTEGTDRPRCNSFSRLFPPPFCGANPLGLGSADSCPWRRWQSDDSQAGLSWPASESPDIWHRLD